MGVEDHKEELEQVERHLRKRGFRWTAQRQLIIEAAFGTHEHFSADELLDMCRERDKGVSRATVYRTLGVLEEEGFVEGLDTGDGTRKFEHVLGHEHHDHMICTVCGRIIEFVDDTIERLQESIAARHGFSIENHELRLFGRCMSHAQATDEGAQGSSSESL